MEDRKRNRLLTGTFLALIFGMTCWSLLKKDTIFSEKEKRYLQQKPEFSWEALKNGSFGKDYETYLNDQFPKRDLLNLLRTDCERLAGKTMISGVYLGRDHYLMEHREETEFETALARGNERKLLEFTGKAAEKLGEDRVRVLMVPGAETVLEDCLPPRAPEAAEKEAIARLEEHFREKGLKTCLVPALETLTEAHRQEKERQIYYRTDHHWTEEGAFLGYEAWAKSCGKQPWKREDFVEEEMKNDFFGTLSARTGIQEKADTLLAFLPAEKQDYRVIYSDGESASLYAEEMLSGPEPYAVYLKGNQALTEIRNESLEGGTLLVLKDSYGNAMIPFLANHFETIYVIDQRYWRGDPEVFMEEQKVTDLCILYGYGQFIKEPGFLTG